MTGLVVCVEYDDLLAVTLPANMRHLRECLVVTSPGDVRTRALVAGIPAARCFVTDLFYRGGAHFNKGRAVEAAFDVLGRDAGWVLIWDADTLLPDDMRDAATLDPACLYGARRRMCEGPDHAPPWSRFPVSREAGFPGFFHLFHTSAPSLCSRPWYDPSFRHAGGGDGYFQSKFPADRKRHLPGLEVLHLGPRDTNWCGRVSPRVDGDAIPDAAARAAAMRALYHRRTPDGFPEWNRKVDDRVGGVPPSGFSVADPIPMT